MWRIENNVEKIDEDNNNYLQSSYNNKILIYGIKEDNDGNTFQCVINTLITTSLLIKMNYLIATD